MSPWLFKRSNKKQAVRQKCGVYAVGHDLWILPLCGKIMFVFEPGSCVVEGHLDADDATLGQNLKVALDHSQHRPDADEKVDYPAVMKAFQEEMERFRSKIGFGKKKFEDSLAYVNIERIGDDLLFWPHQQRRGKFAFEGTCREAERPLIAASSDDATIGAYLKSFFDDPNAVA